MDLLFFFPFFLRFSSFLSSSAFHHPSIVSLFLPLLILRTRYTKEDNTHTHAKTIHNFGMRFFMGRLSPYICVSAPFSNLRTPIGFLFIGQNFARKKLNLLVTFSSICLPFDCVYGVHINLLGVRNDLLGCPHTKGLPSWQWLGLIFSCCVMYSIIYLHECT